MENYFNKIFKFGCNAKCYKLIAVKNQAIQISLLFIII